MMNLDDYKQVDGQVIINRAPIDLSEAQETFVFNGTAILRKDIERAKSWYLSEVDSEKSSKQDETKLNDFLLDQYLWMVGFVLILGLLTHFTI